MNTSPIGQPVTRVDGTLKVTGAAKYAADQPIANLAYGIPVTSTIGNGKISRIDTSAAERMPGVLAILHHGNAGPLFRPAQGFEQETHAGETRPPFEDEKVYYFGQYVALVLAETFEQGLAAATKVQIDYEVAKPLVQLTQGSPEGKAAREYHRGDAESAFAQAPVKIDQTYTVPVLTHNPMEMHATIAVWQNDKFTLYESTQGVVNHHHTISQMLDMPFESVQVISPFIGSGFGGKLFPWPHSLLAAVGARCLNRPVKVTVPRSLMFTTVGHRPNSQQRIRLGATRDGKLVSVSQQVLQHTSLIDDYVEQITEATPMLYSSPNVHTMQHLVHLNVGTPTSMRGPGNTPGLFALESAMDELAIQLDLDPLELRLRNYAETDEGENKPFSSKHLRECYQVGAEKFGWSRRTPKVGSMRKGDLIVGWGMATSTWPANRGAASVRVRLLADGTARVSSATQDIGTGTYTIFAQVVADKTGLPIEKIRVVLGDSSLPPGPISGGSTATATVLPAIAKASTEAVKTLFQVAVKEPKSPFHGADPNTLAMTAGAVHAKDAAPESGIPFERLLAMRQLSGIDAQGDSTPSPEAEKYSTHCFGAQFCEVTYDASIVQLRITRWLSVIDAGRIINTKAGANQILGAVVMGIGMGLFEHTFYDTRNGKPVNNNFADYVVPVNKDIPELECIFLDHPDLVLNEYGARGIGEIGITGVASALAMATYHATGVRVRELPIRIEDLLA